MYWKYTSSQAFQVVEEFLSSSEQIWRNWALHHLLTNTLQWMNRCRQNESKQPIKNITVIHNTTEVHHLICIFLFFKMYKYAAFLFTTYWLILMAPIHYYRSEDPSVSKWYNAKFLQICSNEETNQSSSWIALYQPYHPTAQERLPTEAKQGWAKSVPGWETSWEN